MTASVNGVNFENLTSKSFVIGGNASTVQFEKEDDGGGPLNIQIQGTNALSTSNGIDIEINLFISIEDWKESRYELKGEQQKGVNTNEDTYVSFSNLNDSDNQFNIEHEGEIRITKFDLEERIIEGTFSFSYNIYEKFSSDLIATENVENGTFKYSLDDEYFD